MKNNKINLLTNNCTYWEGKLYCLAIHSNLIFSVHLQDGKIELVDTIPEEDALATYICGAINVWNGKLILTPCKTKKIWIYDLASKQWTGLTIKKYEHWGAGAITQTYIYNDNLFLIGSSYPAIICLDLKDYSCEYIAEPYKEAKARQQSIKYTYFRSHGVRLGNTLYLASSLDNFVLEFDMETRKHQWIKIGNDNYVYSGITWDGSNFWLSPRLNGDIVKWDGREEVKILPLSKELQQTTQKYLWEACFDGSKVVLPATVHTKSIRIDIQKDSFQFYEQQYPLFVRLDNGMVVSQTTDGELSVSTDNSSQKLFHVSVESSQLKQFYDEKNLPILNNQTLYYEAPKNQMLSLAGFLEFIEPMEQKEPIGNNTIGKAIWETIR